MKQKMKMNGVDVVVEINPPKLYGKIFTDWVEEKYRGVLPKLSIEKKSETIMKGCGYREKPNYYESWELFWRYENDISMGNTKTIRIDCIYNYDGSIRKISFSDGLFYRGSKSHITTEKGLKISIRNIKKKFLDNPKYRGKPFFYEEDEMWSSIYND